MPYVTESTRRRLDGGGVAQVPGELNYLITSLCLQYMQDNVGRSGLRYDLINDVMGALSGAQAEFYRRVAAPYEDRKVQENGDVYEGWTSE